MKQFYASSMVNNKVTSDEDMFKNSGMYFKKIKYHKNDTIINVGDKVEKLYYLKQGTVRLYLVNSEGDLLFYHIKPGTTFGEAAFFNQVPAKIRAIAIDESIIYAFPKDIILTYFNKQDEFFKLLFKAISSKIYLITTLFENISNADSKVKLSRLLYILASSDENLKKIIKLTHDELALMLGIHRVTISRNLSKLKKEGVITTRRHTITINDIEKLKSQLSQVKN